MENIRRRDQMAITINIYYTGENGSALRFAEEMISSGVVGNIRAEQGNIRYDYFRPMNDDETVLLIDSWEDQKAIDIHHREDYRVESAGLSWEKRKNNYHGSEWRLHRE
jgi:quinol monooxygenase YgiN